MLVAAARSASDFVEIREIVWSNRERLADLPKQKDRDRGREESSLIAEQSYPALFVGSGAVAYRKTASDPSARVALIANDGAIPWRKKINEFERLRFERLCAYLRHHPPVAQVGYSIFVFDLSDDEISHALYGPPAELTREGVSPAIRPQR